MGKNEINLADNLINIINTARENALKKVNEELINMYWQVGEYLHKESQKSMFGDSYIDSIAKEIQEELSRQMGGCCQGRQADGKCHCRVHRRD